MSGSEARIEKFLARWSRRKRSAPPHAGVDGAAPVDAVEAAAPYAVPATFDPASLPPIEAINAANDLRAFLAPGVPIEVTRAALRRAWVADPVIRDFIEIAENQWDFGKPDGVPGFDTFTMTAELRRLMVDLCSDPAAISDTDETKQTDRMARTDEEPTAAVSTSSRSVQAPTLAEGAPTRQVLRKHGGALPS